MGMPVGDYGLSSPPLPTLAKGSQIEADFPEHGNPTGSASTATGLDESTLQFSFVPSVHQCQCSYFNLKLREFLQFLTLFPAKIFVLNFW